MRRRRRVAGNPHVARLSVRCAEGHGGIGVNGHGQAARHDRIAIAGRGDEQAQSIGFGHQARRRQRRRRAEPDLCLRHQCGAANFDLAQQGVELVGPQTGRIDARDGAARPRRALVRRADDDLLDVGQCVLADRGIAEPPARSVRDQQILAEDGLGELRQIGAQSAVFGQRRSQRIGDEIRMLAHGLQQSHGPGETRCVELERIGRVAGHAAHDQVDRHQAVQRLERHAVAGDAQVAAFDQQQPEIASQISVAEVVVVARARASAARWSGRRDWPAGRGMSAAAERTAPAASPCTPRRYRRRHWCAPCGWRARSRCRPGFRYACRSRASARRVRARCRWRRTGGTRREASGHGRPAGKTDR